MLYHCHWRNCIFIYLFIFNTLEIIFGDKSRIWSDIIWGFTWTSYACTLSQVMASSVCAGDKEYPLQSHLWVIYFQKGKIFTFYFYQLTVKVFNSLYSCEGVFWHQVLFPKPPSLFSQITECQLNVHIRQLTRARHIHQFI